MPLRRNRIRGKGGGREILEVIGDDHFHARSCGGGKHMAVLGVVRHRGNQVLIAVDPRFQEMPPNFAFAVDGLLGRETKILLESSAYFYHDLIRPFRQIETWACGKAKQCVCQRHGDRDTRIQQNGNVALHSSEPPFGNTFRSYKPASNASRDNRSSEVRRSSSRFFANLRTSRR